MARENAEIVREMLDAFNDDDVPAVLAAFDESCVLIEPSEMLDRPARGFLGHDGIREWMEKLRGLVGARFEPRSFTSSGDVVFSEWASATAVLSRISGTVTVRGSTVEAGDPRAAAGDKTCVGQTGWSTESQ